MAQVSRLPISTAALLPQDCGAFLFVCYNLQAGRGKLLKGFEAPLRRDEGWVPRHVGKVAITSFPAEGKGTSQSLRAPLKSQLLIN